MNISLLTLTVTAAATLSALRGVTVAGAVPTAGGNVIGFTRAPGVTGDLIPVDVIGTADAEAGAAIAAGALLEVDSVGRVITRTTGVIVGRMAPGQPAATAAGQTVEILLIAN